MLFGNESISHYAPSYVSVWMLMAFQAGILNIGGFMACQRYVSHITGFITRAGYEITQATGLQALETLLVPVIFLVGSMISGILVDLRLKLHKKPKYYFTFGVIFFTLIIVYIGGILGSFGQFGEPLEASHHYVLLILLCFTCGVQNATITTVSRSIIRTTHLTGLMTDLGIGLVRFWHRKQIQADLVPEAHANLMRLGIIFFFGFGSVCGGFTFSRVGHAGFLFPVITSGILFGVMVYFQIWKSGKHS